MARKKKEIIEENATPSGWVEGAMPEPVRSLPTAPDPKPTPKAAADPEAATISKKEKVEKPKSFGIYYGKSEYKGHSFLEALRLAGIDSSFLNRKKIAEVNGINNYLGLGKDNKELLEKFVAGELVRPK